MLLKIRSLKDGWNCSYCHLFRANVNGGVKIHNCGGLKFPSSFRWTAGMKKQADFRIFWWWSRMWKCAFCPGRPRGNYYTNKKSWVLRKFIFWMNILICFWTSAGFLEVFSAVVLIQVSMYAAKLFHTPFYHTHFFAPSWRQSRRWHIGDPDNQCGKKHN